MRSEARHRYVDTPAGTTASPALARYPAEEMPPARETPLLSCRIDWPWVRSVINGGEAVAIVVSRADVPRLIDTAQQWLGFDLVIRINEEDVLWLCRPVSLAMSATEET